MKGFKTRVIRPGSARPKAPIVPGVTEASHTDLAYLFMDSKQKDLELEKSRSRLLLHIESKKSQDEKDIMSKKYQDTIQTINDTHQSRMKALTRQHEMANEALMEQFKQEIFILKSSHKSHIDRLLQDSQEKSIEYQSTIEALKQSNIKMIDKLNAEHKISSLRLQETLETQYNQALNEQKEWLEQEKHDFCEKSVRERDLNIKNIINKLYEECRKEWKAQETKLTEEILSLRLQLDTLKLKSSQELMKSLPHKIPELSEDSLTNFRIQEPIQDSLLESVELFTKPTKPQFSTSDPLLPISHPLTHPKESQTSIQTHDQSTLTDALPDPILSALELHNDSLFSLDLKLRSTLQKKNAYIHSLESQLTQLLLKNKELAALLHQLNC